MPARKIPPEAVTYYVSLGPGRSYEKVAQRYGVTKRAVTKLAAKERWQEKVDEIERSARQTAEENARREIEAAHAQQIAGLRLLFRRGVEALQARGIESPADATRAIQVAVREWRLALGEPTDRTAVTVEETIRREYERWMVTGGEHPGLPSDGDDVDGTTEPRSLTG